MEAIHWCRAPWCILMAGYQVAVCWLASALPALFLSLQAGLALDVAVAVIAFVHCVAVVQPVVAICRPPATKGAWATRPIIVRKRLLQPIGTPLIVDVDAIGMSRRRCLRVLAT